MNLRKHQSLILTVTFAAVLYGIGSLVSSVGAQAQAQPAEPVQPWGLPPLPQGVGPIEQFADVGGTPQGKFLEGGSFDTDGNFWFVGIGSGWISYLTPDAKLVPVVNCNPPPEVGQDCEPPGLCGSGVEAFVRAGTGPDGS